MPQLPFITVLCLACGQPAQPGFHFCADHLRLPWEQPQVVPVARDVEEETPVPVHVIECHPSSDDRMSAAGYRLLRTEWDPVTLQAKKRFWVLDDGDE
jgi:hypothetical protein